MFSKLKSTFFILFSLTLHATQVDHNGLKGALFLPESEGPHPVVITLTGSNGGLSEDRAKELSKHGLAGLAIAHFNYKDLPAKLNEIPLEYFEKAFDFIDEHPQLDDTRIGVYGVSRGGELSLILASWFPEKFQAVVATAPSNVVIGTREGVPAWTYQGQELRPPAFVDASPLKGGDKDHPATTKEMFTKTPFCEESAIPVENITANVLLITGGDDNVWPSEVFAEQLKKRLKNYKHCHYPKAGHGINIPTSDAADPLYYHSVAKKWFHTGGTQEENQRASEESFREIINFLSKELIMDMPDKLYKITTPENWEASQLQDSLSLEPQDITDGFIHFSREDQVDYVLERFYKNKPYVILVIDPNLLKGRLVYEYNSKKTDKFYHIYDGAIPMDSVLEVKSSVTK